MSEVPARLDLEDLRNRFRHLAGRLEIFVDGELQHRVVSYDIDEGQVVKQALDEHGNPELDDDETGIRLEIVVGKVAVQLRAKAHA